MQRNCYPSLVKQLWSHSFSFPRQTQKYSLNTTTIHMYTLIATSYRELMIPARRSRFPEPKILHSLPIVLHVTSSAKILEGTSNQSSILEALRIVSRVQAYASLTRTPILEVNITAGSSVHAKAEIDTTLLPRLRYRA
jgi:hypothetical protein